MSRWSDKAADYKKAVADKAFDVASKGAQAVFYSDDKGAARERAEAFAKEQTAKAAQAAEDYARDKAGEAGRRAEARAREELAKHLPATTLEQTPAGKWLDDQKLFEPDSPLSKAEAVEVWNEASKKFAEQASGEVRAFVNGARPDSVFRSVELPTLLQNPAVTAINGVPRAALASAYASDPERAFQVIAGMDVAMQAPPPPPTPSTPFGPSTETYGRIDVDSPEVRAPPPPPPPGSTGMSPPAVITAMAGAGMPAARLTDPHVCPMITVLVPHVGGPILPPCCINVLIGKLPAARVGDMALCVGPPDVIVLGSFKVMIGKQPAARMGDITAHGGAIVMGFPTVLIA